MKTEKIKNNPKWKRAYRVLLKEFYIDPKDKSYSGAEDAAEYLSGARKLERFCIVSCGGSDSEGAAFMYACANCTTPPQAYEEAMQNIGDDIFPETPICVVDLETWARFEPVWSRTPWRLVSK